jgi:PIN domain nuclease of toxin-antitoxin system
MILLDTHVLVWWMSDPAKLSVPARTAIDGADTLGISAISDQVIRACPNANIIW